MNTLQNQSPTIEDQELLKALNPDQLAAVQHEGGPAMVLAGAGSGKTRVLTTRVAWLMKKHHLPPEAILLVTFTNKAAGEMNERVERQTGFRLPFSGTFHRISARILRVDGHHIGLTSSFIIYDSDDQQQLIKSILKQLGYDHKEFKPGAIIGMISNAKNEMISPDKYKSMAHGKYQEAAARVYKVYQFELKKNNAVDFDDLLLKTLELFHTHPEVLAKYQRLFEHVLVDEYQDTNKAQYLMTKLLAAPQNNLFVVGDAAQAIYSWRGADYRNLSQLKIDFPDISEYRLEQNYRSTQTILDAASRVIENNTTHPVLDLWTEMTGVSHPILIYGLKDNQEEARKVAEIIGKQYAREEYDEVAILYRTNAQSRSFEEAFLSRGIPYRIVGGVKFYARKEIKDLLSYLRLVLNPNETVSLERVSKVGKRRYEQFDRWRAGLLQLAVTLTPLEMLDQILEATKYKDFFDANDTEDISRLENIEELRSVAAQFPDLDQFLENVALVDNSATSQRDLIDVATGNPNEQMITLMSLHSAKGLEYESVFLVGMEEGLFPHSRSLMDRDQMEEERRLCYVGITRAKNRLYLTYAAQRFFYGSLSASTTSRFLKEIPEELVQVEIVESRNSYQSSYGSMNPNVARRYQFSSKPTPQKEKRRLVVDDGELDDILSGDIDLDAWLKK
ncbi:MAG: UvrD-helicase domain-containing protein [Patescibacteria group bacterium]